MSMETSPLRCYLIRTLFLSDWFSPSAPCSEKWARPRCRCFFVVQVRAFHFAQPLEGLNLTCRRAVPRPNKIRMRASPMFAHSVAAEAETPRGCVFGPYIVHGSPHVLYFLFCCLKSDCKHILLFEHLHTSSCPHPPTWALSISPEAGKTFA